MLIFGIVLGVLGLLLVVAFILSRVRCTTKTEATVGRLIEKKMYLRGRTVKDITPVFTYTFDGKQYEAKADLSTTNAKRFTVGQKEYIYIDASHPENIRYGSNIGFLLTGIVIAAIGIFIIVIA